MAALKRRGLQVQAFKSGPDYIDPMFHSRVLGVESRNLDLFLQGEAGVRRSFSSGRGDVALVEGAMGYYDGLNGGTEASAWELARTLQLPTVLLLRVKGTALRWRRRSAGCCIFVRRAGLQACCSVIVPGAGRSTSKKSWSGSAGSRSWGICRRWKKRIWKAGISA